MQAHSELASKHEAKAFAGELADDGYDVHQAESFVFLFADDGATARMLGSEQEASTSRRAVVLRGRRPYAFV